MKKLKYQTAYIKGVLIKTNRFDCEVTKNTDSIVVKFKDYLLIPELLEQLDLSSNYLTYQISNNGLELTIFDQRI